jgi:hypothetical protein
MATETVLDVTALPPPEPLEAILNAVTRLRPGDRLRVLHHREPWPLFGLLEQQGFAYHMQPGRDAPFEILIWHADVPLARPPGDTNGPHGESACPRHARRWRWAPARRSPCQPGSC